MNKLIILLAIFVSTSISVQAQSGNKLFAEAHEELLEIASDYVQDNPEDLKADSLLKRTVYIRDEYTLLLDKLSGGKYSYSRVEEKVALEKENNKTSQDAFALSRAYKQSFKANNQYFPTVSSLYNNILIQTKLALEAKKSKKKSKKKKKRKN